jgi:hypothetical protein
MVCLLIIVVVLLKYMCIEDKEHCIMKQNRCDKYPHCVHVESANNEVYLVNVIQIMMIISTIS